MNWFDIFQDVDTELSLEDLVELELEYLAVAIPTLLLSVRQKAGLTQSELAELMGCQVPHVSKLERASMRLPQIKTIARYLNAAGARLTLGARHQDKTWDISYRSIRDRQIERQNIELQKPALKAVPYNQKSRDYVDPAVNLDGELAA